MPRVAVLTSHPTPYMAPFYRRLAQVTGLEVTVLYCSAFGTASDPRPMANFGQKVVWDVDPFGGYRWRMLHSPIQAHPQRRLTVLGTGLVRELQRERYDALVVYGWAYPVNWLSFLLARARAIPFLLYGDTNVRAPGSHLPSPLRRGLAAGLCGLASGALYTGTFNRDYYIRNGMPPERLWFSPLAVDSARFAAGRRELTRKRLGLRDGVTYLLFVGTLVPRKRPDSLLTALHKLQHEGHAVGAVFAGAGELEPVLRRQVEESRLHDVELLGFVNQSELPDLYAAADVFVLPSRKDPRGMVVNEAMAAGRPVIVSTGTGVWGPGDLVEHGREGFVVDTDDDRALAESVRRLLDPSLRQSMGHAASERAAYWSFDRAAAGWVQAVDAVTRGS